MTDEARTAPDGDGPGDEPAALRFAVAVDGFSGGLEDLVQRAQRGDVDLAALPVGAITAEFRARVGAGGVDPREVADFLALASRLLSLKVARLLPDGPIDAVGGDSDGEDEAEDPGARLAEYRLFRRAADTLLSDAVEDGMRSFLSLVSADVIPNERLLIDPERLAGAFRRVLERISEPTGLAVAPVAFSVEDKVTELRALLVRQPVLRFEQLFAHARSRLEAVASFLALLELVRAGDVRVRQDGPYGDIVVSAERGT